MSLDNPKVSIGLPVYNGEKYIEKSIESILEQTFTDFELIITDNASTDRSPDICNAYAEKDKRIRFYHNEKNIGGTNNHNLTFELAKGEYFRWAAHDDFCASTLLEECTQVLDNDQEIILVHPAVVEIDEFDEEKQIITRSNGTDKDPYKRFTSIASSNDFMEESYGLMRTNVLMNVQLPHNYTGSDRTFLSRLSLYGRFGFINKPLFYKRLHPGNEYKDWRTRMAWFDEAYKGKIVFPFWMQFFDYLRSIKGSRVSTGTKIRSYAYMLGPWLIAHFKNLSKDIIIAGYMLLHSKGWRSKKYEDTLNWS